ncbi:MAG: diphthine--ammonia ligase [Bacilli bacterium]
MKKRIALSFSGGKDSMMMLDTLYDDSRYEIVCLYTTITSEVDRVSLHGTKKELSLLQAEALQIPLEIIEIPPTCTMEMYETLTHKGLRALVEKHQLEAIAFGDLHLEEVYNYRIELMKNIDIPALFPLWQTDISAYMERFYSSGYEAVLVAVGKEKLPRTLLGTLLNQSIAQFDCDPAGENGEYHSFVVNGPLFSKPVLYSLGDYHESEWVTFIDLLPASD